MWPKLALVAFSIFVGLLVGEVVVRIVIGAPLAERLPVLEIRANPHRGWEMVPSRIHYTYHHQVAVNALGLRGAEVEAKRQGEIRVLALGDSLTFGQGVGDHETLPHFLETLLQKRDPRARSWTVVNGGHRAYNTHQELALLEELGERLQPDIVVVLWYWNDLEQSDIDAMYRRESARGQVSFDTRTKIEGWERLKWEGIQLLRRSALIMYVHDVLRGLRAEPVKAIDIETGLKRLGRHLDCLIEIAESRNFRPVFAVIPDPNAISGAHESELIDARAARLASERGLRTVRPVEPLVALYRSTGRLPLVPYDGHYSAEANLGMAEAIAQVVLNETQAVGPESPERRSSGPRRSRPCAGPSLP